MPPTFGAPLCERCRKSGTIRLATCYKDMADRLGRKTVPLGRLFLCNEHYGKLDMKQNRGFKHMVLGKGARSDDE